MTRSALAVGRLFPATARGLTVFAALLVATPARADVRDHLSCVKVKDSAAKTTFTVSTGGKSLKFFVATGCVVKLPAKLLCGSVEKTNVTPTPPGGGPTGDLGLTTFLCYKMKCPKAKFDGVGPVVDQFATHTLKVGSPNMLCAPAEVPSPSGAFLDAAPFL